MPINGYTKATLATLMFVALSAFYSGIALQFEANSDSASMFLQAIDMARGNILLRGWNLSTVSFYFTEIAPHAIAVAIFGERNILLYIVPAVMYAALVMLLYALMRQKGTFPSSIAGLAYIAIPSVGMIPVIMIGATHIGAYVLIAAAYLAQGEIEKRGKASIFALAIFGLMTLAMFSDGLTLYVGLAPMLLASVIMGWINKKNFYWLTGLACVSALLAAKALAWLFGVLGAFNTPGTPAPQFVALHDLDKNIILLFEGMMHMFDGHFFGRPLSSLDTVISALHFLGMLAFIAVIWRCAKNQIYSENRYAVELSLLLACAVCIFSYVLSTMPVNIMTTRYLVPFWIFGAALVGRNLSLPRKSISYAAVAASAIYAITLFPGLSYDHPKGPSSALVAVLEEKGLEYGYGTFWNASSVTVASNNEVQVRPLHDGSLARSTWLTKDDWYSQPANFVVLDSQNDSLRSQAIATLGKPVEVVEASGKTVMVWSHNITPFIE